MQLYLCKLLVLNVRACGLLVENKFVIYFQ